MPPISGVIYAAPVAGTVILLLLFRDVLITVFNPEGNGGPLFRAVSRAAWVLFRTGRQRRDLRGMPPLFGPLLVVMTPTVWLLLLVLGFALLYLPWVMELIDIPGAEGPAWAEAVYHSLNAASTLGMGDVHARHTALRWVTALQAFAGFGLVTAALSYFMAVYRELPIMRTLAMEISTRLEARDVAEEIRNESEGTQWDEWFDHVARSITHLRHILAQYPILHYFRPRSADAEFLLQLRRLLDLCTDIRQQDSPATRRAAFRALSRAAYMYASELHGQFVGGRLATAEASADADDGPDAEGGADADDGPDPRRALAMQDEVLRYFALR